MGSRVTHFVDFATVLPGTLPNKLLSPTTTEGIAHRHCALCQTARKSCSSAPMKNNMAQVFQGKMPGRMLEGRGARRKQLSACR